MHLMKIPLLSVVGNLPLVSKIVMNRLLKPDHRQLRIDRQLIGKACLTCFGKVVILPAIT
jgi:hypothetical protein